LFHFHYYTRYIDNETGRRSDTAHYYIYNQDHNKNLKILVRHRVVRVIFEYVFVFFDIKILTFYDFNHCSGTRAVGIEYVDDTIGRENGTTEPLVARASRLVVLSAGTFGSPAVLERSGIGSKDVLTGSNIQQLVDLPGVGEHYMGSSN
jgi:alcohol oxidase